MPAATTRELRRFGLTVGGAFLILGSLSRWRGHTTAPAVMWVVGTLLVVPGLLVPAVLVPVYRFWMGPVLRVATLVGEVVSRVFLGVLFYLVFAPIGLVMRRFRDPLDRTLHDGRASNWVKRPQAPVDPKRYEQTF
jgi:hypothetical protein